ncbi:MAG: curli biogenesis system outer membrane secretion channel CsgG [Saprospiraceae bacterium]|jgi:curli biogenesis system outer membrane secretion channel CsgG
MKNLILAGAVLLLSANVQADFVAYSMLEGGKKPLPERLDNVAAESLVNIEWGSYQGAKSRIGVLPVENNSAANSVRLFGPSGSINYDFSAGGVPVQGIEAILIDVMNTTGRFRLLERTVLSEALAEQDLGATGRLSAPSAAKVGKVLGAQYLLQGVITNYEEGVQKSKSTIGGILGGVVGGAAGSLLGGFGTSKSKGVVGMNIRLIDSETSEIVFSNQAEVDLSSSGMTFGGGIGISNDAMGGFVSNYSKTPIGQAVIAAANKSVFELIKQIGAKSASGSVVKSSDGKIYLNMGQGSVEQGDILNVLKKGEELIDPDTGISLGGETELMGTIRVTTVKEKFSIAQGESIKASQVSRGDAIESTKAAAPLEFASEWVEPKRKKKKGSQSSDTNSDNK